MVEPIFPQAALLRKMLERIQGLGTMAGYPSLILVEPFLGRGLRLRPGARPVVTHHAMGVARFPAIPRCFIEKVLPVEMPLANLGSAEGRRGLRWNS